MKWKECLEKKVYKRQRNKSEAESLLKIAKTRIRDNKRRERTDENTSLIVESYWEIIKQLITSSLNLDGYKSYSQECLISYLKEFYDLSNEEINLIDELRRLRNDIDYRGKFLKKDYLERKEEKINQVISKLEKKVEKKLNKK